MTYEKAFTLKDFALFLRRKVFEAMNRRLVINIPSIKRVKCMNEAG